MRDFFCKTARSTKREERPNPSSHLCERCREKVAAMKKVVARNEETERIANEVIKKMKSKEAEQADNNPSGKVHLVEKNGVGFLQFHKNGKLYPVGRVGTRCQKFIQSLTEPHFGVHKTIDAVFEAIRQDKDGGDERLGNPALKKNRMGEIISYTIKELQKKDKVPGKLLYKRQGKEIWLEEK